MTDLTSKSGYNRNVPNWLLVVSALFALMEIGVSITMFLNPESFSDKIDIGAKGVLFLVYMWFIRQFALGSSLAFATWQRSTQMLFICYLFFLVMFIGDLIVGLIQNDINLAISSLIFVVISSALLFRFF